MGVPKRKVSKARQGERRAHLAISAPPLVECEHCHELKRAHHVCPTCGWYNGREAVTIEPSGRPKASSSNDRCASRSTRWEAITPLARSSAERSTTPPEPRPTRSSSSVTCARIERELAEYGAAASGERLRLVDAPEVIEMGEHPATALRTKRRASIVVATDLVRDGDADAVVSAGSTGATMAAAIFRLGRIERDRPPGAARRTWSPPPARSCCSTSAPTWTPSRRTSSSSRPWARSSPSTSSASRNPRIGLLNIGEEVEKGDERAREAHAKLGRGRPELRRQRRGARHDRAPCRRGRVRRLRRQRGDQVLRGHHDATSFDRCARTFSRDRSRRSRSSRSSPASTGTRHASTTSGYGGAPLLGVKGVSIVTPRPGQGADDRERHPGRVRVGARAACRELIGEWTRDHPALAHRGVPVADRRAAASRASARTRDEPPRRGAASATGLLARRLAMLALFEAEFRPGAAPAALERLAAEREVPDEVRAHAAEHRLRGGRASVRAGRPDRRRSTPDSRSGARSSGADDPPERPLRGAILRRDPERGTDA